MSYIKKLLSRKNLISHLSWISYMLKNPDFHSVDREINHTARGF